MARPEKQRSTVKIYADILTAVAQEGDAKPTRILQRANLPHDRMMKHISELQSRGLLVAVNNGDGRYYKVTDRGLEFVEEVRRAGAFLSAFGVSL